MNIFLRILKPDFNLDMLRANNYICHFFVAKKALSESVGKFRAEYNGAQDYDLIYDVRNRREKISHVAKDIISLAGA